MVRLLMSFLLAVMFSPQVFSGEKAAWFRGVKKSASLRCEQLLVTVKNRTTSDVHTRLQRIMDFGKKGLDTPNQDENRSRNLATAKMLLDMFETVEAQLRAEGLLHHKKRDMSNGFLLDRTALESRFPIVAKIVPKNFLISMNPMLDVFGGNMQVNPERRKLTLSHGNLYSADPLYVESSVLHEMVHVVLDRQRVLDGSDLWGLPHIVRNRTAFFSSEESDYFWDYWVSWIAEEIFTSFVQALAGFELLCESRESSEEVEHFFVIKFAKAYAFLKGHRIVLPKYLQSLSSTTTRLEISEESWSLKNEDIMISGLMKYQPKDRNEALQKITDIFNRESDRLRKLERVLEIVYPVRDSSHEVIRAVVHKRKEFLASVCKNRDLLWSAIDEASGSNLSRFRDVLKD